MIDSRDVTIAGHARIRASELLGDTVIPTSRTLNAPRFDDLLNSFDKPVRDGLRLLLTELGLSLERRGADMNQAALKLRPALAAADTALTEIRSQNASLKQLIVSAERFGDQAASRTTSLAKLVDGLAASTGETARHLNGLDLALEPAGSWSRVARQRTEPNP